MKSTIAILTLSLIIAACGQTKQTQQQAAQKGLKDYFSAYFDIVVAVNMRSLTGDDSALVVREFNSVTPENDLKIGPVHPSENEFKWGNGDAIIAFAARNNLKGAWP